MLKLITPITQVDTIPLYVIGTRTLTREGNEFVYMRGVVGTVTGSWVTYNDLGVTALLALNANGPVAVAMAPIVADRWGWYCVKALSVGARIAANTAVNSMIGRETADGDAGDGFAATDEINNAYCRVATAGVAAVVACQINYPFVRIV